MASEAELALRRAYDRLHSASKSGPREDPDQLFRLGLIVGLGILGDEIVQLTAPKP